MTTDKRIAKAKAAAIKAMARASDARKKLDEDCRIYRQKRIAPCLAAQKAARDATASVTALELEAAGIVPMETIVRHDGGLWAVMINSRGYAQLNPMTKAGRPHMGRYAASAPNNLARLFITDMKVKT